jgi:hypothetical protein
MSYRYVIDNPSWPVTTHDHDLTTDQILDVLDQVTRYYPGAVASLADTEVPQTTSSSEEQTP